MVSTFGLADKYAWYSLAYLLGNNMSNHGWSQAWSARQIEAAS